MTWRHSWRRWASGVFELHTGPLGTGFQSHLELSGEAIMPKDAETAIQGFVALLTRLAPDAKRLWDGATKRDFNVGIQGGTRPHAFETALLPQTLAAVADLGARVVITVYAVDFKYLERQHRRRTGR